VGPVVSADLIPPYAQTLRGVAVVELDGQAVLCTVRPFESVVVLSDLRTGRRLASFPVRGEEVSSLGTTVLDGTPVLLTYDDSVGLGRYDLRTHAPLGPPVPLPGTFSLTTLSVVHLGGRPNAWSGHRSAGTRRR
jgi:hypothetical protein